jgi:3-oxoacyl-[acyl-carrier-protein] synthase II
VNAHGTSTALNDATEAKVLAAMFDAPAVTSTKGVVGHALGAAGAIEAVFTALAVQTDTVPPTANLTSPDPEFDLDLVSKEARTGRIDVAVSNSFGFGGQNAVLVFTSA